MPRKTALLSDAVDQYVGYLAAKRLEHNTIRANSYVLRRALSTWGNIQVNSLAPRHMDLLFAQAAWGPSTHNTNLQMLKSFFAWCRNMGYMPHTSDPAFGWRNQRVPKQDKLRVPVERFDELLEAADHPRDRAIIACGLFLFLRGSELAWLKVGGIDFSRDEIQIYRLKTKEEDTLPICSELREELVRYLNWYRADQGELRPDWYLLPAKATGDWVPAGYKQMVRADRPTSLKPTRMLTHTYAPAQRVLQRLGYDTLGEGGHTLRRSGARAMADQLRAEGYDGALLRVASMLGHKDIKQTQVYIGWQLERQQRNEALAGKPMFAGKVGQQHRTLRLVQEGE